MKTSVFEKLTPLWTAKEVAEFLRVKESTIRDLVYRKKIPFRKVGKSLRFSPEEIEKWTLPNKGAKICPLRK